MKFIAAFATLLGLAFGHSSYAAEKTLSWHDELCRNSIRIDTAKYDEAIAQNTIHLLFGPPDFAAPLVPPPFKPEDISKLDLDRLNQACTNALNQASQLKFIPLRGIDQYRSAKISEIKDACKFETVKIRAFADPSALREYEPGAACSRFIDALEGKSNMLTVAWETLIQNCNKNGAPDLCVYRSVAQAQLLNGVEWVRLYLLNFGWNNCANSYTVRNADAKRLGQMRADLEAQFRRTFKVTKDECDSPPDAHPEFGPLAILETDNAPGTLPSKWNIVAMGLFCGSPKLHPGRIVTYVYGIDYERLRSGEPLAASLDIDGKATGLMLQPYDDVALAPVEPDLVRRLLKARAASVLIKNYNSPSPDRLKLDDLASKVRTALGKCFRS